MIQSDEAKFERVDEVPEKRWSWWIFFIVGGLLKGTSWEAGLISMISLLVLTIASAALFYKLTRKIKFVQNTTLKYILVGLILIFSAGFLQGCAGGVDKIISQKQEKQKVEQMSASFPEQLAAYKVKANDLAVKNKSLSEAIIDPTKTKKEAEANIRTLKEMLGVSTEIYELTASIVKLLENMFKAANVPADFVDLNAGVIHLRERMYANIDASISLNQAIAEGKKAAEIQGLSAAVEQTAIELETEQAKVSSMLNDVMKATK